MSDPAFLLLHSPLLGPTSWSPVRDEFDRRGYRTVVPDLVPAVTGPAPHIPAIAGIAVAALGAFDRPVTLVVHSGAGALVPAVVAAVPGAVGSVVFVDASLPYPGRSWFDSAPVELVDHVRELAGEGDRLPPWHEWFGPGAIGSLVPDPVALLRLCADVPHVPLSYLREVTPNDESWQRVPSAYLRLSAAYRNAQQVAIESSWPTMALIGGNHLTGYTDPARVVDAVERLLIPLDSTNG